MSRSGIELAGTVILDVVNIIDHWPAEETLSLIQRSEYGAGGPPHNAAAGLVRLGAPFPVSLTGAVGDDAHGEILLARARALGLDTACLKTVPGASTSYTLVMSSAATGRRTFFHHAGVNDRLTVDDLAPAASGARLFYAGAPGIAGGLDGSGGWPRLLAAARAQGFATCLELVSADPAAIRALAVPCLPHCDYLVVNEFEAGAITGSPATRGDTLDGDAAARACRRLLAMGVARMAAIHHPSGAVAVTAGGTEARRGSVRVPPHEIARSVGAGDAFYAGTLFGIHEDWPLDRCLDLGNAAAATSLHSPTTSASIRPWAECLAYAERCGVRPAP